MTRIGVVIDQLRRFVGRNVMFAPDRELSANRRSSRDQDAFAALVERYGGMVMGVCRRILQDGPDGEDAFQATFVILARKAGALGNVQSLAAWLYTVALNVA